MASPRYLFVYGTLRRHQAPPEIAQLMKDFEFIGEAVVPGDLFDLGEYPGAIFEPDAKTLVRGEVFRLPGTPNVLRELDRYEEFTPRKPEKSLFIRETATVKTNDGQQLNCWVYRINHLPAKKRATRKRSVRPATPVTRRVAR